MWQWFNGHDATLLCSRCSHAMPASSGSSCSSPTCGQPQQHLQGQHRTTVAQSHSAVRIFMGKQTTSPKQPMVGGVCWCGVPGKAARGVKGWGRSAARLAEAAGSVRSLPTTGGGGGRGRQKLAGCKNESDGTLRSHELTCVVEARSELRAVG